jgi:formiminotetrahydrofolate cyclodeaminase
MTPAQAAVDVQVATDEDLRAAINDALEAANVNLEELRDQAETSQFASEEARIAWFMISELVDRIAA